jgi:hypothetical protein
MQSTKPLGRPAVVNSAIFIILGLGCLAEALRLKMSATSTGLHQELGPGAYVFLLGACLVLTGIFHYAQHRRLPSEGYDGEAFREALPKFIGIILCLVAYGVLTIVLGYLSATVAFFIATFALFAVRPWHLCVGLSIVCSAVLYLLFVHYFGIIFPRGLLM